MRIKRLVYSPLTIVLIISIYAMTFFTGSNVTAVTILDNGNWSFNYVADNTTSYYQALSGYSGSQFVTKLNEIISANTTRFTYGGGSGNTGDRLRYTDESPRDSSKVVLLYSGHDISKASLNLNSDWTWNQEHTWAKSHGFQEASSNPAYCDLHHLRPTYQKINATRGNLDFGEVANYSGTVKTDELYGSKVISNVVFEPRDAVKGDVARIMMYMDVRYAGKGSEPNLTLNNKTKTASSALGSGEFGNLDTLLKWHNQDPVDDLEKRRNDRIYELQGNRNPFIDHPEFIEEVYGTEYTGEPSGEDPNSSEDLTQANIVINAINNIGTVTINSEDAIDNAKNLYNALTSTQKDLVTNYQVLLNAITEFEILQNHLVASVQYNADFDDILDYPDSYTQVFFRSLNNYYWKFSAGGRYSSETRLGDNDNVLLPEKFKTVASAENGVVLEMLFDVENAMKISFSFSKSYGTNVKIGIAVSYNSGQSYQLLDTFINYTGSISKTLGGTQNARFALIILGGSPRVVLNTVEIKVNDEVEKIKTLINALGEVALSEAYYNKLVEVEQRYNSLTSTDKARVTNYSDFVSKKDAFDTLVIDKACDLEEEFDRLFNKFILDPFDISNLDDIELFFLEYNMVITPIKDLLEEDNINSLSSLHNQAIEIIDYLEYLKDNITFEVIEDLVLFYENSDIKDYAQNNEEIYIKILAYKNISLNKDYLIDFENMLTDFSILFNYDINTLELTEGTLKIRFGACITKEMYDALKSIDEELLFGVYLDGVFYNITPVRVNEKYAKEEDLAGNFYQFAGVISIPISKITQKFNACVFVSVNDINFFMEEVNLSFIDIAKDDLKNLTSEDEHYDILDYISSLEN